MHILILSETNTNLYIYNLPTIERALEILKLWTLKVNRSSVWGP